nr:hypothetical protein [Tanacetum cinerariifolium]
KRSRKGYSVNSKEFKSLDDKDTDEVPGKGDEGVSKGSRIDDQERTDNSTQDVNTAELSINTASTTINIGSLNINTVGPNDHSMPSLEETSIFDDVYDDREVGAEADTNNLELLTVILDDKDTDEVPGKGDEGVSKGSRIDDQERTDNSTQDVNTAEEVGAEADTNNLELLTVVSPIPTTSMHKDHPKEQIIGDLNLATQTRRMLNFSKENAMTLVDLPNGKRAIGTKWGFRNKKDERGIVVRNKARLVAQEDEVYVCQPPGFEDPYFPNKVYKVEKPYMVFIKLLEPVQVYVDDIIFGSTKKSLCDEFEQMMHKRFQMSSMRELTFFLWLQVKQKDDGIFISQDKYVANILKKFDFTTVNTSSTLIKPNKALIKDAESIDVDVHLYRSMIGSLMYLTASRPDIMFAVCACARFQVTPKTLHLHVVKRIFRYLKSQPKLGLWYSRDSPFDLEAFSDSDYDEFSIDTKSTIRGCQFLSKRLISWQSKKQTIVSNSTTKAEYVAAANCCGQVLWIQNQMLDYGFNFTNTKIYIDNKSTICIVKNPVSHSKTKHIEIRHHFIRDSYEKKLIQVIKIYVHHNVADLLTKAFDVSRFNFLIAGIGLLNL